MLKLELGNRKTVEDLIKKDFVQGKFVFRRDDSKFRLYMGIYNSHPDLVKDLKLVAKDESQYQVIWGGGSFQVERKALEFSGASGTYGQVPNSFLIEAVREVKIPGIEKFVFKLASYDPRDPNLEMRRETWRKLGNFELDTIWTRYEFDENMQLKDKREISR